MENNRLREAAENAYNAWMGGTMNDVREAMKELGEVLESQLEHYLILKITDDGIRAINDGKMYNDLETCREDAKHFNTDTNPAFVAKIINQTKIEL